MRLDEIARAEETGDRPGFAHRAERALPETFAARQVFALEFFSGQRRKVRRIAEAEVLRHIDPLEAGQTAHADVVKLREQKRIDEVPAIDGELRVIDGLFRDLKTRRP